MAKISKKRKEALRDKLYGRDGSRCHYCRIKEGEEALKMAEFKKVRSALKDAIKKSQQAFLLEGKEWDILDGLVGILLMVVEDMGYSKEEMTALYEELKKEIEEESKGDYR